MGIFNRIFGGGDADLKKLTQWADEPERLPKSEEEEQLAAAYLDKLFKAELPDDELRSRRAGVRNLLGRIRFFRGNLDGALEALKQGMIDDVGSMDVDEHMLMLHELKRNGLYEHAVDYATFLNGKYKAAGDQGGEMVTAGELGQLHKRLQNHATAFEYVARGYGLAKALGSKREERVFLMDTALLYMQERKFEPAVKWGEKCLALVEGEAEAFRVHGMLARCHAYQGRHERAKEHIDKGLKLARGTGDPLDEAAIMYSAAEVKREAGEAKAALTMLEKTEELYAKAGNMELVLETQRARLTAAKEAEETETILVILAQHLMLAEDGGESMRSSILSVVMPEILERAAAVKTEDAVNEMAGLYSLLNDYAEKQPEVSHYFGYFMNVLLVLLRWFLGKQEEALESARDLDTAVDGGGDLEAFLKSGAVMAGLVQAGDEA